MSQGSEVLKLGKNKTKLNLNPIPVMSTDPRQNIIPLTIPTSIPGGDATSKLMSTKIVRIHLAEKCACVKGFKKFYYQVNTISRIDDMNRENENEIPLFDVEEKPTCDFCPIFCPPIIKYEFTDVNTKDLFSISETRAGNKLVRVCCRNNYYELPEIFSFKPSNLNDVGIIRRYDTRAFYRTYEYLAQPYYKIGEPYVEKEVKCTCANCISSIPCFACCNCCNDEPVEEEPCCTCCTSSPVDLDKRIFIDIYNMVNQVVGKFAEYYDTSGCCCCLTKTLFHEIYFPPDSNEMLRLSLISQVIFFHHFHQKIFGTLPGTKDNVVQFIK